MTDLIADPTRPQASGVESAGSAGAAGLPAWFARALPDFMNPVLVKEVRQAQRGKVFSVTLIVTLVLALLGAASAALEIERSYFSGSPGQAFFSSVYVFFNIAVLVVVPFQAFVSMGAEHDDNTFEMLVLSNLKPRQIVMGKITAALTQGLMFGLTFLPFVVTAFLLRGVDLTVLMLIMGLTAFASTVLTTFAVMLSAVVRKRLLRVLAMVALAGGLFLLVPTSLALCYEWFRSPELFGQPGFYAVMVQTVLFMAVGAAIHFAVACNMLAHEEENRSTNIRVAVSLLCVITVSSTAYNVMAFKAGAGLPREVVYGLAVASLFFLATFCIFFALEPDRLGRRVEPAIPQSKLLAVAVAPWMPGGSRGLVFAGVHVAGLMLGMLIVAALAPPFRSMGLTTSSSASMNQGGWGVLVAAAYCALYVVVPAVLLRKLQGTAGRRNVARLIALCFPMILMFVPTIFGLFINDYDMQEFRHMGNPAWVIEESWDGDGFRPASAVLMLVATVTLFGALSLGRIAGSFGEVLSASRANAARPKP